MRPLKLMTAVLAMALPAAAQYQPVTLFKAPDASESSQAFCYIGNDGTVTGHRRADGQLAERGYVLKNREFELLELVPGSDGMFITGITGKGDPIGVSFAAGQFTSRKGVIWRHGVAAVLPAPPVSQPGNFSYFFPQAANNQESMVGQAVEQISGGQTIIAPMLLRNGTFTPLPPFPLANPEFVAFNDRGDILVQAIDFSQNPVRYRIFKADLNGYQEIEIPGAFLAAGMDNSGRIAAVRSQGDYILFADGNIRVTPGLLGAATNLRSLNQKGQSCGIARTQTPLGADFVYNFVIDLR
jgi:hypothetical protein